MVGLDARKSVGSDKGIRTGCDGGGAKIGESQSVCAHLGFIVVMI